MAAVRRVLFIRGYVEEMSAESALLLFDEDGVASLADSNQMACRLPPSRDLRMNVKGTLCRMKD
eukprot:scaffold3570_cov227-Amphora_coffeaeformis.AAC.6